MENKKEQSVTTAKWKKYAKVYQWALIFGAIQLGIFFYNHSIGIKAAQITGDNLLQMMMLIPPIFIIMGLMDVWVPKETLMKYMGEDSGAKGLLIAFVLGTVAAGPIYIAFPMGLLLLKKGAKLSNIIFFFGVWSSTKLPLVLFEIASFGMKFTAIHILISLPLYLLMAYYIERIIPKQTIETVILKDA